MIRTAALLGVAMLAAGTASGDTFGHRERVRVLSTLGIEIDSQLDARAPVSTLRASDVKYFNKDGGTWVRFIIDNGSVLPGSRLNVERPVLKDARVRQRDGSIEHRPTVAMAFCVGRRRLEARLQVSDRSGYTAPLTLGAAEIAQLGAVDPAREYTIEPSCDGIAELPPDTGRDNGPRRSEPVEAIKSLRPSPSVTRGFVCDGRQYCSQMRSRAEAEFFVANCRPTKMDGDNDGIPCENDSRW